MSPANASYSERTIERRLFTLGPHTLRVFAKLLAYPLVDFFSYVLRESLKASTYWGERRTHFREPKHTALLASTFLGAPWTDEVDTWRYLWDTDLLHKPDPLTIC